MGMHICIVCFSFNQDRQAARDFKITLSSFVNLSVLWI